MEFTGSLYLILICLILFQGITACVHPDKKAINKIRIKLEKIKEINYRLSLGKIPPEDAALKISVYIQDLQKLNLKVSEDEAFQELLNSFLEKWHSEERVQESLTDGNQKFMSEVQAFYIRGYVKEKEDSKTLLPIFKP